MRTHLLLVALLSLVGCKSRGTFDTKGSIFVGSAWDSLFTTIEVAAIAAPLTAIVGLLSAYVITRHQFVGRRTFEFLTMVSFAIPGTVIGVSCFGPVKDDRFRLELADDLCNDTACFHGVL